MQVVGGFLLKHTIDVVCGFCVDFLKVPWNLPSGWCMFWFHVCMICH